MSLSRRQLLQQLGMATAASALGLPSLASAQRVMSWRNWAGNQSCIPAARLAPASEAELASVLRAATGVVRPVGAGHSFSGLVPTEGTLLSLSRMAGLVSVDKPRQQSEWWGGTPMSTMGAPLKAQGLALTNMADIDYQSLAGAIATSTHGTGVGHGSYSSQVVGCRLVTTEGEVLDCDASQRPELLAAAKVSLGALGVMSKVRLQNRKAFRLREKMWIEKTESLLEQVPTLTRQYQHWEMHILTHSDFAASVALNETTDAATFTTEDDSEGGNNYLGDIQSLDRYVGEFPGLRRLLLNLVARTASFDDRVGDSHQVFSNVRNVRFFEMEYSVPAADGPACLREILKAVKTQDLPTWFPIEYRYIRGDDIPLSMFEGGMRCAISVHQHYTQDYHNLFAALEPIFWRYGGRPHWGKLHSLGAAQLSKLYPRWDSFLQVRETLDPKGKLLNAHLRKVFGV